jgi:acetyl esterase/lipase
MVLMPALSIPLYFGRLPAQVGRHPAKHGLTMEDILRLEIASDAAIDAAGSRVAIVVQRSRTEGEPLTNEAFYGGYVRSDVIVFSATTGAMIEHTNGHAEMAGYWHPVWSPDGTRLAMLALRGDTLSMCVWNSGSHGTSCLPVDRSLDYLTAIATGISSRGSSSAGSPFLWLSDSVVAVALLPPGRSDKFMLSNHRFADSVTATWARTAKGVDASVSSLDTPRAASRSEESTEVVLWNVNRGEIRTAFHLPYMLQGFRDVLFSPDHRWAAVSADSYQPPLDPTVAFGFDNRRRKDLGIVEVVRDTCVRWLPHRPFTRFMRWSSDGSRFGVLAKRSGVEHSVAGSTLFAVDPVRNTLDSVRTDTPADSTLLWLPSLAPGVRLPGNRHGGVVHDDGRGPLPGDVVLAEAPGGAFAIVRRLTRNGTMVFQIPASGGAPKLLLSLNSHLARVARPSRTLISYAARDGSEQHAVLLLPAGYQRGARLPLVTWVYPGDVYTDTLDGTWLTSMDDPSIVFLNPDILAGHGYAVLFPSMPLVPVGATGDPCLHVLDGVEPAVDSAIALGIADSARLGIIGQSYGGYAVNCIVSQSHRFRAAVSSAGIADLTSFALQVYPPTRYTASLSSGLAWAEAGQGRMGSVPWRDAPRYVRNSPVSYVDSVRTPILIVTGDDDFIAQAEEWFTALDRAGKRARLLRYWGEGHILRSPANMKHFWHETLQWLGTYLGSAKKGSAVGDSQDR